MANPTAEVVIARPIDDVFAVLTDVDNTAKWFPAEIEEHWTSAPPHGVGSTRRAVFRAFGRSSENIGTVTEYDPPRRAAISVQSHGLTVLVGLTFSEVSDGTRVAVDISTAARGLMRLVIGPFMRWYAAKWRQGLIRLKAMMESGQL